MIYFDINKKAYGYKIKNAVYSCSESLWADYNLNPDKYIWRDNQIIFNPDYDTIQSKKERERISRLSLTKREVFLALYRAKGITPEQLKEEITDPEALIEFEYANEYFRFNPLIDLIGAKLGYTADDLDYLFINKELPAEQVKEESEGNDVE